MPAPDVPHELPNASAEMLMCLALVRSGAVDGCSISLLVDASDREELASTDADLSTWSELEFSLWEGPGADLVEHGSPMLVDDVRADSGRWPQLVLRSQQLPLRGLVALPLLVDGGHGMFLGYWREPHRCLASEVVALAAYARAVGMVAGRRLRDPPFTDPTRSPISPAVGMVMARMGVSADDALDLLRSHAFAADTTVFELARGLVRGDLEVHDVV